MARSPTIRIGTWNLEWAIATSRRGTIILDMLRTAELDILCLTEACEGNFPSGFEVIESSFDYGYPVHQGRRKVLLGSKTPWTDVDQTGHIALPSGRFVAGSTQTSIGAVRVIGICVPWRDAHVRSGRRDRRAWEDHSNFLDHLGAVLGSLRDVPTIVMGDFNQALPRYRQPVEIARKLEHTISGFEVATRGLNYDGSAAIDHIALRGLNGSVDEMFPKSASQVRLSDHFGVSVEVCQ